MTDRHCATARRIPDDGAAMAPWVGPTCRGTRGDKGDKRRGRGRGYRFPLLPYVQKGGTVAEYLQPRRGKKKGQRGWHIFKKLIRMGVATDRRKSVWLGRGGWGVGFCVVLFCFWYGLFIISTFLFSSICHKQSDVNNLGAFEVSV